ncbi:hypothetical protein A3Q56_05109 [Intoshia linei]|uniref:Uncharacterized protein n=1 Tax=Intoshia linei TaxID=1819745 RepID=A0A177AYV5_9BILA|nr:hypothetical protein A3Q56_05109 [Intoshia linei]
MEVPREIKDATVMADMGGSKILLKRQFRWKNDTVVDGYVNPLIPINWHCFQIFFHHFLILEKHIVQSYVAPDNVVYANHWIKFIFPVYKNKNVSCVKFADSEASWHKSNIKLEAGRYDLLIIFDENC